MAQQRILTIPCARCKAPVQFLWSARITAGSDPEAERRVQEGSLFEERCTHCGQDNFACYACLYLNPQRGFGVQYEAAGQAAQLPQDLACICGDYVLRAAATPGEFFEKIAVLTRGLDDRAIEFLKWACIDKVKEDFAQNPVEGLAYLPPEPGEEAISFSILAGGVPVGRVLLPKAAYDLAVGALACAPAAAACPRGTLARVDARWAAQEGQKTYATFSHGMGAKLIREISLRR